MWCHLLLFMPIVGLGLFIIFPWAVALPMYGIITAISVFIYYKIMGAMRQPVHSGREALLGATATVVTGGSSAGQIRYRNELWSAVSEGELRPGELVKIVGFSGMKLIVHDAERTGTDTTRRSHCYESAGNRQASGWR